jgi:Arf-GAP/SH3 domain/ANK repeat/PH domain-containing protein
MPPFWSAVCLLVRPRRFCFEILTPSSRRIYQATGESEMTDWVSAISKSIESLLNG